MLGADQQGAESGKHCALALHVQVLRGDSGKIMEKACVHWRYTSTVFVQPKAKLFFLSL